MPDGLEPSRVALETTVPGWAGLGWAPWVSIAPLLLGDLHDVGDPVVRHLEVFFAGAVVGTDVAGGFSAVSTAVHPSWPWRWANLFAPRTSAVPWNLRSASRETL